MCITIPLSANVKKARQWGVWQWLAATPLRLYLIAGLLLSSIALAVELTGLVGAAGWSQFNLLFVLVPCLLLGAVFQWLPGVLKVTPVSYVRYASLFFILLLSQVFFHAAVLRGEVPGLFFLMSLGAAWGLLLRTLRNLLKFSYSAIAGMAAAVFHLLLLAAVAGLLMALGLHGEWLPGLYEHAWIWLMPLYLCALLVLLFLRFKLHPNGIP